MLPTGEPLVISIRLIALHKRLEMPTIQRLEKFRKNARIKMHARLASCVATTRSYQKKPDLTGMHHATNRLIQLFPRTVLRKSRNDDV